MIDSLSIYHWHLRTASDITLSFYFTDADGECRVRHHTPTGKSLARFMYMVWRHTAIDGAWVMSPCPVGDTTHWNYSVRPSKEARA